MAGCICEAFGISELEEQDNLTGSKTARRWEGEVLSNWQRLSISILKAIRRAAFERQA